MESKSKNNKDRQQFEYINEKYKTFISSDIPLCLQYKEKKGFWTSSFSTKETPKLEKSNSMVILDSIVSTAFYSRLSRMAIELCSYQSERYARRFGGGKPTDATHALLEELKNWISEVSNKEKEILLKEVNERIPYLMSIERSNLFPVGKKGKQHLVSTLNKIISTLNEIQKEIMLESSQQNLSCLSRELEIALEQGVYYLYFVAHSNQEHSLSHIIDNMRAPESYDSYMKTKMGTASGQMLFEVINSPAFIDLFPPQSYGAKNSISPSFQSNSFLPIKGSKFNALLKASNKNHGLCEGLFVQKDLEKFTQIWIGVHGWLIEIANFTLLCKKLEKLAKMGGDILIYGLMQDVIIECFSKYIPVLKNFQEGCQFINNYIENLYQDALQNKKYKFWLECRRKADTRYKGLQSKIRNSEPFYQKIVHQATIGFNKEKKEELEKQIVSILEFANSFCINVNFFLTGEKPEQIIKKEFSTVDFSQTPTQSLISSSSPTSSPVKAITASAQTPTSPQMPQSYPQIVELPDDVGAVATVPAETQSQLALPLPAPSPSRIIHSKEAIQRMSHKEKEKLILELQDNNLNLERDNMLLVQKLDEKEKQMLVQIKHIEEKLAAEKNQSQVQNQAYYQIQAELQNQIQQLQTQFLDYQNRPRSEKLAEICALF